MNSSFFSLSASFLIVGVTRDSAHTIKKDIAQISSALQSFSDVHWFVVESDSEDNTIQKLKELEGEVKNFSYISLGVLHNKFPLRTERIAYCRNRCLDELKSNSLYKDIDYVVTADLDGMNGLLTKESFLSCWKNDEWDVCTANQRGPYYDIWALRQQSWSPNDCWSQFEFLVKHHTSKRTAKFVAVHARMVEIDEDSDWIEVDSAFGGLAVYRREVLSDARYIGLKESGEEICEHLSLHKQIKEKGFRIFINPGLINTGFTRHTKRFRWRYLKYLVRKLFV